MLPRGALDDAVPDDRWLHEATGNAGASLERAWRRAALVVWPRSRTLTILAGAGIGGAVAWLAERIERDGDGADIARLASEVVGIWPAYRPDRDEPSRARMLGLLPAVGDGECLSRFLFDVVVPDYTGAENGELPAAIEAVGPETGTRFLTALVDARLWRRPEELLALLRRLEDEGGATAPPLAWSGTPCGRSCTRFPRRRPGGRPIRRPTRKTARHGTAAGSRNKRCATCSCSDCAAI